MTDLSVIITVRSYVRSGYEDESEFGGESEGGGMMVGYRAVRS